MSADGRPFRENPWAITAQKTIGKQEELFCWENTKHLKFRWGRRAKKHTEED